MRMLNNSNTEVAIGVLVDDRGSLNSGADAKWTSMNADEHADLRSVVEQIPLHCMVGTGEVMTGGVSALLLIVLLFKSATSVMPAQCGALVQQLSFILLEKLSIVF